MSYVSDYSLLHFCEESTSNALLREQVEYFPGVLYLAIP